MSRFGYPVLQVMHDSTVSSTYTSNPYLVQDLASISVSWVSNTGSASVLTVQATNDNGFTAALVEGSWSLVTAIVAKGLYTVDPGARWTRIISPSVDSLSTVNLAGWAS